MLICFFFKVWASLVGLNVFCNFCMSHKYSDWSSKIRCMFVNDYAKSVTNYTSISWDRLVQRIFYKMLALNMFKIISDLRYFTKYLTMFASVNKYLTRLIISWGSGKYQVPKCSSFQENHLWMRFYFGITGSQ